MAFTPFVESDRPTMSAFNEKFLECIAEAVGQSPKIEMGNYLGTGTQGQNNPNSLTFAFEPKALIVAKNQQVMPSATGSSSYVAWGGFLWLRGQQFGLSVVSAMNTLVLRVNLTWDGDTVSWYQQNPSTSLNAASVQLNQSNTTYYYLAIG